MFRWLALCLVLCAGAFALVALATGAFLPRNSQTDAVAPPPAGETAVEAGVQPAAPGEGAGRGGATVLSNWRTWRPSSGKTFPASTTEPSCSSAPTPRPTRRTPAES